MWRRAGIGIALGMLIFSGVGCSFHAPTSAPKTVSYEPSIGQLADWSYQITRGKTLTDQLQMYELRAQYTGTQKVEAVEIHFGNGGVSSQGVDKSIPIVMDSSFNTADTHTPLTIKWTVGPLTQWQTIEVKMPE